MRYILFIFLIFLSASAQDNPINGAVRFTKEPIQVKVVDTTAYKVTGRRATGTSLEVGRLVKFSWSDLKAYFNSSGTIPPLQSVLNAGSEAIISTSFNVAAGSPSNFGQLILNESGFFLGRNGGQFITFTDGFKGTNTAFEVGAPVNNNDAVRKIDLENATTGNFIPLSGTEEGIPVTGDLELKANITNTNVGEGLTASIGFEDGNPSLNAMNILTGLGSALRVTSTQVSIDSQFPESRGLSGNLDFTANIQDLDYTQKKYVDNAIAAAGSSYVPYNGAISNLDLGVYGISSTSSIGLRDYIDYNHQISILYDDTGDTSSRNVYFPPTSNSNQTVAYRSWVTDAIAAAGSGGTVTSVTGTGGVTVANGTTTPVIGLGNITPTSVAASGTVTGSNLSGTNTGDNAANTTSNAYADGKVQNNLNPSTTVAPSATAVNTGLALKGNLSGGNSWIGNQTLAGNIIPEANGTRDIGALGTTFLRIYSTIGYFSNIRSSTTGGTITFGSSSGTPFGVIGSMGDFSWNSPITASAATLSTQLATLGQVQAAQIPTYVSKTASYTLTSTDYTVALTGASSATFTLPTAVGVTGKIYVLKNRGTGMMTVNTTSSQTMDGATSKPFSTQYSGMAVQSNGANWDIIGLF